MCTLDSTLAYFSLLVPIKHRFPTLFLSVFFPVLVFIFSQPNIPAGSESMYAVVANLHTEKTREIQLTHLLL